MLERDAPRPIRDFVGPACMGKYLLYNLDRQMHHDQGRADGGARWLLRKISVFQFGHWKQGSPAGGCGPAKVATTVWLACSVRRAYIILTMVLTRHSKLICELSTL